MYEDVPWEDWFNKQYELTAQIDKAVEGLSENKTPMFRVALYSAVIEHCAEIMRNSIPTESI